MYMNRQHGVGDILMLNLTPRKLATGTPAHHLLIFPVVLLSMCLCHAACEVVCYCIWAGPSKSRE